MRELKPLVVSGLYLVILCGQAAAPHPDRSNRDRHEHRSARFDPYRPPGGRRQRVPPSTDENSEYSGRSRRTSQVVQYPPITAYLVAGSYVPPSSTGQPRRNNTNEVSTGRPTTRATRDNSRTCIRRECGPGNRTSRWDNPLPLRQVNRASTICRAPRLSEIARVLAPPDTTTPPSDWQPFVRDLIINLGFTEATRTWPRLERCAQSGNTLETRSRQATYMAWCRQTIIGFERYGYSLLKQPNSVCLTNTGKTGKIFLSCGGSPVYSTK
jgi:hypothetical protein